MVAFKESCKPAIAGAVLLGLSAASGPAWATDAAGTAAIAASKGKIASHVLPDGVTNTVMAEQRDPLAYQIGAGDKLRIKFFQRDELSGEFQVRADGNISLPLIGSFDVRGRTPVELEQLIAAKFYDITNSSAFAVVDVIERRPFFVAGDVNRPGTFPYFPRMTVVHAVAIAGGFYRIPQGGSQIMDMTREQWRLRSAKADAAVALAKRERIKALLNREEEVDFPTLITELAGEEQGPRIIDTQRRLFEQARRWRNDQKDFLRTAVSLAEEEIKALRTRLTTINDILKVHDSELDTKRQLLNRGLTRRQSVYDKQYAISNLLTSAANVEAEIKRAEIRRNQAMQAQNEFWPSEDRQLSSELAAVEAEFERQMREIQASNSLLGQSAIAGLRPAGFNAISAEYTILRRDGDKIQEIAVGEHDRVRPGDVLKVSLITPGEDPTSRKAIEARMVPLDGSTSPIRQSSAGDDRARQELVQHIADLKKILTQQNSVLKTVAQSQADLSRQVAEWRSRYLEVIQRDPPSLDSGVMPVATTEPTVEAASQPAEATVPVPVMKKAPEAASDQAAEAGIVLPSRAPRTNELDSRKLAMVLQTELARLGCYRGPVDGDWGPLSRRAISEFSRITGVSLSASQPNLQAFAAVMERRRAICQTRRIVTRMPIPGTE